MADVKKAITYVLGWEDSTLSGKTTTDDGGRTRFGIAEKFHPSLTASLFYTSLGRNAALEIAEGIYEHEYCEPLCIALITNQAIANKLLSLAVNIGIIPGAKMLQNALSVNGDGRIGPITLDALDNADPQTVLTNLRAEAVMYYHDLIQDNPRLEIYRAGWLRRAEA